MSKTEATILDAGKGAGTFSRPLFVVIEKSYVNRELEDVTLVGVFDLLLENVMGLVNARAAAYVRAQAGLKVESSKNVVTVANVSDGSPVVTISVQKVKLNETEG